MVFSLSQPELTEAHILSLGIPCELSYHSLFLDLERVSTSLPGSGKTMSNLSSRKHLILKYSCRKGEIYTLNKIRLKKKIKVGRNGKDHLNQLFHFVSETESKGKDRNCQSLLE